MKTRKESGSRNLLNKNTKRAPNHTLSWYDIEDYVYKIIVNYNKL